MSVVHSSRSASVDEIATEMDRRGAVIESLEAALAAKDAALSSQSLSLSEAREEIERLRGERDEALQLAYDLKYAAAGGEDALGSAHAVTVDDVDRWRREAWDVAATDRCRVAEAIEALRPFAAFAKYWDELQTPDDRKFVSIGDACKLTVGDLRRAKSVLENGPAVLADAHSNPPLSDLSSLRKGAEVEVNSAARDLLFHLEIYDFNERDPSGQLNEKMAGLKAALVSGSREDGADA